MTQNSLALLSLGGTIVIYVLCKWLYRRVHFLVLTPILTSFLILTGLIVWVHMPYHDYSQGTKWLTDLLQPATVAFAIPLYRHFELLRRHAIPILLSLLLGAATGIISSTTLAVWWHLGTKLALTLAPRSVTTPIAMDISHQIGGIPVLTAVFVIMTGITGAIIGPLLIRFLPIRQATSRGVLLGMGAHGIGTARAFELSQEIGAISSLSMVLGACITLLLAPWIAPWLIQHL